MKHGDTRGSREAAVDDIDRALLALLEADGRISYKEMSERIGLSSQAVSARVTHLVERGIAKVIGSIAPEVLGYDRFATIAVTVDGPIEDVAAALVADPATDLVAVTVGDIEVIAEVVCRGEAELLRALDRIRCVPHVVSCVAYSYLRIFKYAYAREGILSIAGTALPGSGTAAPFALDETDKKIVEMLRADGRATFTDLAAEAATTYATARRKYHRLVESGVVRIRTVFDPSRLGSEEVVVVFIDAVGDLTDIGEQLAELSEVTIVMTTMGPCDLIVEAVCADMTALADFLGTRLRAVPGIVSADAYPLLRVDKLAYTWAG
ncbi:Lrp/AsnC family transcriptional regulator [Streptomyces fuscichromogenes]|uniref:Lrp/AsnC family transcriptional regulator n=1 Tax=Streptomyces fuscichromogenes TaxID=1324013 RepID=UPI003819076F